MVLGDPPTWSLLPPEHGAHVLCSHSWEGFFSHSPGCPAHPPRSPSPTQLPVLRDLEMRKDTSKPLFKEYLGPLFIFYFFKFLFECSWQQLKLDMEQQTGSK